MVGSVIPATTFTMFSQLSPDVRNVIWDEYYNVTRKPRIIKPWRQDEDIRDWKRRNWGEYNNGSVLLVVCQESRGVALRYLKLIDFDKFFYVDLTRDFLHFEELQGLVYLFEYISTLRPVVSVPKRGQPDLLTWKDLQTNLRHIIWGETPCSEKWRAELMSSLTALTFIVLTDPLLVALAALSDNDGIAGFKDLHAQLFPGKQRGTIKIILATNDIWNCVDTTDGTKLFQIINGLESEK